MGSIIFFCVLIAICQVKGNSDAVTPADGDEQERVIALDLIKRGETLALTLEYYLKELKLRGQEHLLGALEHELVLIKELSNELKQPHLDHPTYQQWLSYIHHLEELLLHHENRVAEEFVILQEVVMHNQTTTETKTIHQLVNHVRELIHKADESILKHSTHVKEVNSIKYELKTLKKLIYQLEHEHESANLLKVQLQVKRHELTLNKLLERIAKSLK